MASLCFKSTLFQIEPGEDSETNPHRYGKQLARWLGDRLTGIAARSTEQTRDRAPDPTMPRESVSCSRLRRGSVDFGQVA